MYTATEMIILLEILNFLLLAFECYSTLSFYHRVNLAILKEQTSREPYPPSVFWDILTSNILSIVIGGLFIWFAGWVISLIKLPFYITVLMFLLLMFVLLIVRNIIYSFVDNVLALIRKDKHNK